MLGVSLKIHTFVSGNTLYGTASSGGTGPHGTVFKINTDGTGFSVLWNFQDCYDGNIPHSRLLLLGGVLYGTTTGDSTSSCPNAGTIFKINTDGTGFATLVHLQPEGSYGSYPYRGSDPSELVAIGNTFFGNIPNYGIFKLNANATTIGDMSYIYYWIHSPPTDITGSAGMVFP